jgi:hypothetical protein
VETSTKIEGRVGKDEVHTPPLRRVDFTTDARAAEEGPRANPLNFLKRRRHFDAQQAPWLVLSPRR